MSLLTTGTPGSTLLISTMAAQEVTLLLADRTSLRGHGSLINQARMIGQGSLSKNIVLFGLDGYDAMSTTTEGSATTETALTTASRTLATASRHLRRDFSDQLASVDPTGAINPARLAMDGFASAMKTLTNLIGALASGFSVQVGSTGVAFDHDVFMAAKGKLIIANVPGPYLAVLKPVHFAAWINDLESRPGITQWNPANAEMQIMKGPGYKGLYDGVDVFTSDAVPASGGDYISLMTGRGAIAYAEQPVIYPASAFIIFEAGPIAVEEVRTGNSSMTNVITHYNVGVVEVQDAAGVGMLAIGS